MGVSYRSGKDTSMSSTQRVPANLAAMAVVWGATAYGYTNVGFSAALIVFCLYLLFDIYKNKRITVIQVPRCMGWGMGILYGGLFISTLFHLDHMKNLNGGYFSAVGFILYTLPLWMILYIGWKEDIRKAAGIMLYAILYAMCLYGIVRYFALSETRLDSFYHFPTRIGMMLDMLIPVTAAYGYYYRKETLWKYGAVVLLVLEVVTLFLARVRGSVMALAAAVLLAVLLWLVKNRHKLSGLVKAGVVGIVTLMIIFSAWYIIMLRSGNPFAEKGGERFMMWESSYEMFVDHPVAGVGLNEWQQLYAEGKYHPAASTEIGQVMPHNVFIYFFATGGLIGGVGYCLYVILMYAYLFRKVWSPSAGPFAWAMLFLFTAATVHGLVDQTFILKLTGRILYLLLGIGLLFEERYKDRRIRHT